MMQGWRGAPRRPGVLCTSRRGGGVALREAQAPLPASGARWPAARRHPLQNLLQNGLLLTATATPPATPRQESAAQRTPAL